MVNSDTGEAVYKLGQVFSCVSSTDFFLYQLAASLLQAPVENWKSIVC
jgi:hypothetical protein